MKCLSVSAISLAVLLPATMADFNIWYVRVGGIIDPIDQYAVYAARQPSCDVVNDTFNWAIEDDVSGDKWGVRCSGDGCTSDNPRDIDEFEMNFNDDSLHWSKSLAV